MAFHESLWSYLPRMLECQRTPENCRRGFCPRAVGQKNFEGRFRHYVNSDVYSDPCAYTGICFRLSRPKVTVQIVRTPSGVRCPSVAVPLAAHQWPNGVRHGWRAWQSARSARRIVGRPS